MVPYHQPSPPALTPCCRAAAPAPRPLPQVHSGADLQASASAASGYVPGGAKGYLGYVLANSNGHEILPIVEASVEARAELAPVLRNSRDVLYLDLALETVVRSAAERGVGHAGPRAAALIAPLLQNLALSLGDNEEVCYCLKAWQDLPHSVRFGEGFGKDDALRVGAGLEAGGSWGSCGAWGRSCGLAGLLLCIAWSPLRLLDTLLCHVAARAMPGVDLPPHTPAPYCARRPWR